MLVWLWNTQIAWQIIAYAEAFQPPVFVGIKREIFLAKFEDYFY
jgi:hypothetical protein